MDVVIVHTYGNSGSQGRVRSTTGTAFFLANIIIHLYSSLKKVTASSTTDAGLISLARCGKFGMYLLNLLRELDWSSMKTATNFSYCHGALTTLVIKL